ncbi:hypothetical protein LWI29_007512 [Acer saccharum]|uniref:Xylanase inhibitor N-terminal domain-containing protein n=1 Tax=Acer saccharum TaxID=4024 RepID=A0AA39TPD6_ACESA|nr:hypothetical protein LWI29_007512 [Acer saccharum]
MTIGCGHKKQGTSSVAAGGLLGLGCGSMSFVDRLSPQTGGAFSCCLATWSSRSPGWLTFRRGAHYSKSSVHCEKRVIELQHENDTLKREIEELRYKLADVSSTPDTGTEKLKETHIQWMKALEEQVLGLKKKLEVQSQFSTHKPKSDDAARQFQDEIQRLKAQKVQLQCKLKLESVQFRVREPSLLKEILQVLQRKAKETFMATERLKALLEPHKALACRKAGLKQST